jgi:hypothetical protein
MEFTIRRLDPGPLVRLNFVLPLDSYLLHAGLNINHPAIKFLYGLVHRANGVVVNDYLLRWIGIEGATPQERFNHLFNFLSTSPMAVSCFTGGRAKLPYRLCVDPEDESLRALKLTGPHFLDLLILHRKLCPSPMLRTFLRSLGIGFINYHQYYHLHTAFLRTTSKFTAWMNAAVPVAGPKFHQIGLFRLKRKETAFFRCRQSLENRFGAAVQRYHHKHCHLLYFVCRSRAQFNNAFVWNERKAYVPLYKASYVPAAWSTEHASRLSNYFLRYLFSAMKLTAEERALLERFDLHAEQNFLFVFPRKPLLLQHLVLLEDICVRTLYSIVRETHK